MHMKKWLAVLLAWAMIFGSTACSKNSSESTRKSSKKKPRVTTSETEIETEKETESSSSESVSDTTEEEVEPAETEPMIQPEGAKIPISPRTCFGTGSQDGLSKQLLELDSVMAAELRAEEAGRRVYLILFEVPLDWENPDAGTFLLRCKFSMLSTDAPNICLVDGYMLYDEMLDMSYSNSFAELYQANCIVCEHRFFGSSTPAGLNNQSVKYWEYLTVENAAADFHFVMEQFKTFLTGKWMFTGSSKGGEVTNIQSCFYPDDCDIYCSVVAPACSSISQDGFFDFIYNEIGNDVYDEHMANYYRNMILEFQVEAMKLKDKLAPRYYEYGLKNGVVYSDFATPELLYDMAVLEYATSIWQYYRNFHEVEGVLAMDRESPEFEERMLNNLETMCDPITWGMNAPFFPYYVQAAKQIGEHDYDFSYLREALKKEGREDLLTVTEDMEEDLLYRICFSPEQLESFTYQDPTYPKLVEWSHTTQKPVIMLYGGSDVWYSMRLPDVTDNENVHIFVAEGKSHLVDISKLNDQQYREVDELIKNALDI